MRSAVGRLFCRVSRVRVLATRDSLLEGARWRKLLPAGTIILLISAGFYWDRRVVGTLRTTSAAGSAKHSWCLPNQRNLVNKSPVLRLGLSENCKQRALSGDVDWFWRADNDGAAMYRSSILSSP